VAVDTLEEDRLRELLERVLPAWIEFHNKYVSERQ